jgi:hypothetical protein
VRYRPEINSARMYAGPGSGPMLAAAATRRELAAELNSAAAEYSSVISGLTTGAWAGPSSGSMAAAATPYAGWLSAAAAQAEQAATQATAGGQRLRNRFCRNSSPASDRQMIVAAQVVMVPVAYLVGTNADSLASTEINRLDGID